MIEFLSKWKELIRKDDKEISPNKCAMCGKDTTDLYEMTVSRRYGGGIPVDLYEFKGGICRDCCALVVKHFDNSTERIEDEELVPVSIM